MDAVQVVAADDLFGDRAEIVGEHDDMVAVPAHTAADVEQELGQPGKDGGNLVGNALRRMEVARVEAEQLLIGNRIAEVEFMRADDVALGANAKQLALDGVAIEFRVDP